MQPVPVERPVAGAFNRNAKLCTVLAIAVWAMVTAYPATVRAAPRTFVALEYEVAPQAEGCPDSDQFRASVQQQLGYDPFLSTADRRVAIRISRTGTGFDGSIKWRDARGRRVGDRGLSSRSPECSEIAASVAFAVAVQIQLLATFAPPTSEPNASGAPPEATPPTTSTPDANATPVANAKDTTEASAASSQASRRGKGFGLSAGLGPSLALGLAPDPTGLGRVFASGRIDWFSLELAGDAALPVSRDEGDGSGFRLTRFAGSAAACGHIRAYAGCLTGTLGRIQAQGYGVDQPASPAALFSQVGARVVATIDFGSRYFVSARAEGLVMLAPWAVRLNDTVVWTTPRVAELLGLDFGVKFF